jgi:hypothetical protein
VGNPATELAVGRIVAWAGEQTLFFVGNDGFMRADFNRGLAITPVKISTENLGETSSVAKCQVRLAEIRWSEAATRLREKLATAVALKRFQVKGEETLQQSRCSATLDNVDDAVSSLVKPMKPQ